MTLTRQECPYCQGDCKINIDFTDQDYALLDDRLLGLGDLACWVTCVDCGHTRTAVIRDLDYSRETKHIEFGEVIYD